MDGLANCTGRRAAFLPDRGAAAVAPEQDVGSGVSYGGVDTRLSISRARFRGK